MLMILPPQVIECTITFSGRFDMTARHVFSRLPQQLPQLGDVGGDATHFVARVSNLAAADLSERLCIRVIAAAMPRGRFAPDNGHGGAPH